MLFDILVITLLLAIFFLISSLVYMAYAIYQYNAYSVKVLPMDTKGI